MMFERSQISFNLLSESADIRDMADGAHSRFVRLSGGMITLVADITPVQQI